MEADILPLNGPQCGEGDWMGMQKSIRKWPSLNEILWWETASS